MLTFGAIAKRYTPRWVVWENVPGVLSSNKGRDFGTFLRLLGECGYGFAYRVLDAQFVRVDGFGRAVPQRRRRVFVIGYLGDWRRAAAVLFDPESLCRNPAPVRKAGQGFAADASASLTASGRGVERTGESRGQDPVFAVASPLTAANHYADHAGRENNLVAARMVAFGEYEVDGTASAMKARDYKDATDLIAFSSKDQGGDASVNVSPTIRSGNHDKSHANAGTPPAIAYAIQERAVSENPNNGPDGKGVSDDGASYTLEARSVQQAVAFKPSHYTRGKDGAPSEVLPPLSAEADKGDQEAVVVFAQNTHDEVSGTIQRGGSGGRHDGVFQNWQVRRLMPVECERLQGFEDGHTFIPWKNGSYAPELNEWECPDGHRYKALGNSMSVNVMRWIGTRIEMVEGLE